MAGIVKTYESGGRIYTDNNNRLIAYIRRNGKTYQKRVKNVRDGEQFIFSKLGNLQTLTDAQYTEALHCYNMLPNDYKLTEVVEAGLKLLVHNSKCLIHDAIYDFLKYQETNLRPITYRQYEYVCKRILKLFKKEDPITNLTKEILSNDVIGLNDKIAVATMENRYKVVSALSTYLNKTERINYQLLKGVMLPKSVAPERRVLSVLDAAKLINYLKINNELSEKQKEITKNWRLFILLQMFAGLRPVECCRLEVKDVHLTDCEKPYIYISSEVAKGRLGGVNDRQVEIHPLLLKYLKVFLPKSGKVCPMSYLYYSNKIIGFFKKAGVEHSHDVLRHSAASYLYASGMTSDECARMLGHSVGVANMHYRNKKVLKEESDVYFSLTFAKAASVVGDGTVAQFADASGARANIVAMHNKALLEQLIAKCELIGDEESAAKLRPLCAKIKN